MSDELADQVTGVGALVEPVRRQLYLYVASQPDAVSREQAATALDLPLHSAKFHLDRLVEANLLDVEFRRLSGRTGPGAGRPSKLYRRSARQLSVSLPDRSYDLAGDVLASAIDRSVAEEMSVREAVREVAYDEGRRLVGGTEGGSVGDRPGSGDGPTAEREGFRRTAAVLSRHGYEPRVSDGALCLANCPFDLLAARHAELVCGMNLALIDGVIDGLGLDDVHAELAPQPGLCCVKVTSCTRS